jgi:hypothetical protein
MFTGYASSRYHGEVLPRAVISTCLGQSDRPAKGTQWSGNTNSLPRTSDNHTNLTAHALPRSGFVHGPQSGNELICVPVLCFQDRSSRTAWLMLSEVVMPELPAGYSLCGEETFTASRPRFWPARHGFPKASH